MKDLSRIIDETFSDNDKNMMSKRIIKKRKNDSKHRFKTLLKILNIRQY